ncbi:glycine--tRNA ligase subunit beta [Alkalihalobacillus pseudalcaliphilus]|uniref:glycine--tRNA ligase subunit beta n=1 Tax=Alkalihalobacillus pseudalcaliphilus TaxID=79884 RepID=UPI00064DA5EE|nr:glycine--tRNA ligase subunit beta [Alkalihalobacillus pseudalcaliphilus]KMK75962.1 glycine-tRNA synthetase subunit beta [Alkalihalobacillus pseudalcaliphilus]
MTTRDFLLEIGLEELPARFITDSMNQLEEKVTTWLKEQELSFNKIESFSTPRRLALLIHGLEEKQPDIEKVAKGPAKKIALDKEGNWSKAAQGFARGQGVDVSELFFQELKGVEYIYANTRTIGKETIQLLQENLQDLILTLHFPKNMRWHTYQLRYARPIQWLVAIYGHEVIPFSIEGVQTAQVTRGHRFLGEETTINNPSSYKEALSAQYVLVDPKERKGIIVSQINQIAKQQQWNIPISTELLEEVNNLVEYPTALFGHFDESFLQLPKEVLITSMREHQRYFPVENEQGELLPYFVTVRNGNDAHLENVARGNEKVLRARLADAVFFYEEDQKTPIETFLQKLKNIVYHEELGSIADKVKRIENLSEKLTKALSYDKDYTERTLRVASIAKFDLVTQMVNEFTELQGKMGQNYAELAGEQQAVALAINEHYQPRFAGDQTPTTKEGVVVSIADKIDTIVSCFAIGLIPTGSQDPYALRRQATGVCQIILEHELAISLEELVEWSLADMEAKGLLKRPKAEVHEELVSFFRQRVKFLLQEKGIRYDVIDAVIETSNYITILLAKAHVIMNHLKEEDFKRSVEALSRVTNISTKYQGEVSIQTDKFQKEQEKALYDCYIELQTSVETAIKAQKHESVYQQLADTQDVIDAYFDHIMVMDQDEEIKQNRLAQMKAFANVIQSFADFQKIVFN